MSIIIYKRTEQEHSVKNPFLAAILNFFFFGAGSLYLGKSPIPWILATLGGTAVQVLEIKESPPFDNWASWPWFFIGLLTLKVGLAVDAFVEARRLSAAGTTPARA
jgi:hypothetical protein